MSKMVAVDAMTVKLLHRPNYSWQWQQEESW